VDKWDPPPFPGYEKLMRKALLALLALILVLAPVFAGEPPKPGSKAAYARARGLSKAFRQKVLNERILPTWSKDGGRLWFRLATRHGASSWFTVDAESGERRAAFDPGAVAAAVAASGGPKLDAERLPVKRMDIDERGTIRLLLIADARAFVVAVQDGKVEVEPADGKTPFDLVARPPGARSGTSRRETAIVFMNATEQEVTLFWIDGQGNRRGYGKLGPGAVRSQHTFAGHAWIVVGSDGKDFAGFVGEEWPAIARIRGEVPARATGGGAVRPPAERKRRVVFRDHGVFLRMRGSKKETALADVGTADDEYGGPIHWSPDGRYVLVFRHRPARRHPVTVVESSPKDRVQPRVRTFDYLKPGDRIRTSRPVLFDVRNRRAVPLVGDLLPNPWSVSRVHWAADGSRVYFVENRRGHQQVRLVGVDAKTGRIRVVAEERSPTFVDYSNKLFVHHLEETDEVIWMSERDGWNHLYLIDRAKGRVRRQLTRGEWVVRGVDYVDEKSRTLRIRLMGRTEGRDPYHIHHARVNLDGGGLTRLTTGNGTHEVVWSPDGRYFVDRYSRVDLPPVHELVRADGKTLCELARADTGALEEAGWRAPEPFAASGRDGKTTIWGVIYRPTHFDPERRYPVIESIYAGPHGQHVPKSFRPFHGPQALAELGFITVQIDGMGTNWRSKAFHDVAWKNLKDAGFPDRIAWLRAAAEHEPAMDLSRIGIYGGSAGGQNAMRAVLDHHDFYDAAVADCGCHDNRMDKIWWNEAWMGWPIDESYAANSNVTDAHKLGGKLLLMVGELDRNVDPASTMQVVGALIAADKDFELVVFPGRGHGAGGTPYGVRRTRDFFVRHLLGAEPRAN
jgi:dipeptidyl-peptidase 4